MIGYFPAFGEVAAEDVLALYVAELRNQPADVLDEAFRACVRSCKRFPLVADLLEAVDAVGAARTRATAKRRQEPDPACLFCGGCGWEPINLGGLLGSQHCRCTQLGYPRCTPLPDSPIDVKALFEEALRDHAESHDLVQFAKEGEE